MRWFKKIIPNNTRCNCPAHECPNIVEKIGQWCMECKGQANTQYWIGQFEAGKG